MTKKQSNRKHRGFALPFATVMLMILAITGLGLLRLGADATIRAKLTVLDTAARIAADAAVTKCLFELNELLATDSLDDESLPIAGNVSLSNSNQTYSFSVNPGDYTITATGTSGTMTRTVIATITLTRNGMFEHAVFGDSSIVLAKDTIIDTINSDISLDTTDTDTKAQIGTNSTDADTVVLAQDITIDGDVLVGAGGDADTVISAASGVNITGETGTLSEEIEFKLITPPSLTLCTNISVSAGGTLEVSDSGEYSSITMAKESTLEFAGDVELYVTGDVTLAKDCELTIPEGSSLTLYLDGDWVANKDSGVNNTTMIPAKFKLYATGSGTQSITLKKDGDFFGAIYAPNANVDIAKSGNIYGAIVARTFTQSKDGRIYYDEALRNIDDGGGSGGRFLVNRWQEQ